MSGIIKRSEKREKSNLCIHTSKYYQYCLHFHRFVTRAQALQYLISKIKNVLTNNIHKDYLNRVHGILQEHLMSLCIIDDDCLIDQNDNIQHQQQYHYNKLK